jgi:3'-phosphoadenosine 5'-phosphosulfate (PAPS) 3'-phosphatase
VKVQAGAYPHKRFLLLFIFGSTKKAKKSLKVGDIILGDQDTFVVEEIENQTFVTLVDRASGRVVEEKLVNLIPNDNIQVWETK